MLGWMVVGPSMHHSHRCEHPRGGVTARARLAEEMH